MVDYLIIGAGISGMMAAWELRRAGAEVAIIERGEVGRQSSWAGGGILSPLFPWRYPAPVSRLAQWSLKRYPALAAELAERSGIDPECRINGMLMLDVNDTDVADRWAGQFQTTLIQINESRRRELEPRLVTGQSGLWMPEVGQVRNPRLLQALHRLLGEMGVTFHTRCEATSLVTRQGRIGVVVTSRGEYRADGVIVAGGAWSRQILGGLGRCVEVEPVRGQMLLVKTPPGWLTRIILTDSCYLIPRKDGHVLIGSTMERVGFDQRTTVAARQGLHRAALELVPELADYPVVNHWAGLRPGSPQGVPYIGEHPEVRGLYVSAGHFRNGVATGPASARLLADLILGRAPEIEPDPYRIDRICDAV